MRRLNYYCSLIVIVFVVPGFVVACKTPSSMIGDEIDCPPGDVKILDSVFSRAGSMTTWCARCDSKEYSSNHVCSTNPTRERMHCREVPLGPPCE